MPICGKMWCKNGGHFTMDPPNSFLLHLDFFQGGFPIGIFEHSFWGGGLSILLCTGFIFLSTMFFLQHSIVFMVHRIYSLEHSFFLEHTTFFLDYLILPLEHLLSIEHCKKIKCSRKK